MQCPKCQHENPAGLKYCGNCGGSLRLQCPKCGFENPQNFRFCGECGTPVHRETAAPTTPRVPLSYTPKHLADKILGARTALAGERKTITALFADIKGSMELMEDLDPEEARAVIDPALQLMMDAVHRYEGYVAQSTGDGIFAMFGAPIAHEDHPQRALYAALLMQEKIASYRDELRQEGKAPIEVRVGVNTGEVVVRSVRRDDLHTDYDPIGHSTSLAARMESLARPGTVVVSEHTHRLAEGYFQFKDLGPTKVKGVSDPVRIYEVEGVGPLRTRIQIATRRGLTRFIGRRDEMEQIRRSMALAEQGRGQIVAIIGEAGVGKSRLVYEFKVVQETKCLVLEAFSVSHGKAHAFLPLVELLKDYFRIRPGDDERKKGEKVGGKVLMLDRALEDTLPYLFSLLGVSERASSLQQMDAQIRRQRTLDAVKRLLVRESMNQPLVVIFEDLHWIDAETQAFLDLLADSVATARILLLVNYRPEYRHEWASKTYFTRLRLDPLGSEEAEELLTSLLEDGARAALEPVKRLILAKTEGNPFFMEEVVQTLAEEGVLAGERGSYRLERPAEELHVPTTVQGVLAARIDRLGSAEKNLLQTLATVGKEFPLGLVRKVAEQPDDELYRLLAHLQAAEFIYEQPAFPEPEYTFKHALTQEVAYQSVLVERRKQMHERTAQAMEALYEYGLDEHYAELAHHYSRTDSTGKAIEYLQLAGQQALDRSAYDEAATQVAKAMELLERLPQTPQRDRQELLLQTTLGQIYNVTKGWGDPELEKAYSRARDLCDRVGDAAELCQVLVGLTYFYTALGELHKARELGEQAVATAEREENEALLSIARCALAEALYWLGELSAARAHFEPSKSLYDLAQIPSLVSGVASLCYLAWILWQLGYPDQALKRSQEALALAEECSHPYSLAMAMAWDGTVAYLRGELQTSRDRAEALITLSNEHGFPSWLMSGLLMQGLADAEQGEAERGIETVRRGLDAMRMAQMVASRTLILARLAESCCRAGHLEQGRALIAEALDQVSKSGERIGEPFLYRIKGDLFLAGSDEDQGAAEACYRRAIDLSRKSGCRSYELAATTNLARLWQKQGKTDEARKILSEIYGWFTEGFDTKPLKEAKALLDELA